MPNLFGNNPKYLCCRGKVHVKESFEDLAFGLALFRVILAVIGYVVIENLLDLLKTFEFVQSMNKEKKSEELKIDLIFNNMSIEWFLPDSMMVPVVSLLVIYADRKWHAWAYLPLLIFEAIRIVFTGIFVVMMIMLVIKLRFNQGFREFNKWNKIVEKHPLDSEESRKREEIQELSTVVAWLMVPYLIFFVFVVAILIFTWIATYKAYRYMREVTSQEPMIKIEEHRLMILEKDFHTSYANKE